MINYIKYYYHELLILLGIRKPGDHVKVLQEGINAPVQEEYTQIKEYGIFIGLKEEALDDYNRELIRKELNKRVDPINDSFADDWLHAKFIVEHEMKDKFHVEHEE